MGYLPRSQGPSLPPGRPRQHRATSGALGITPQTMVVFYGYAPAFGLWLLELFGHAEVRILDCNRETWKAGGRPWSETRTEPPAGHYEISGASFPLRSTWSDVEVAIGRPDATLIDVRSAAEYQGERFWPSGGTEPGGRAGHIPTAVHQPVDGLYNPDGSFGQPTIFEPPSRPSTSTIRGR